MISPNTHNLTDPAQGNPTPHTHTIDALEAANIAHFDALSEDYDRRHPDAHELALRLARALIGLIPLDEDTTCVLDYACGSGTVPVPILLPLGMKPLQGQVSRALAPHVARLVGVDISPRMVELYNARADAQGLEPHEMRAVGALTELSAQEDRFFDLVVCSMAYHHFAAVEDVSRELVRYLKPGGTLAVADIASASYARAEQQGDRDRDDAASLPPIMAGYEHIVAHMHGFSEEDIRALFVGAGLENVSFELFTSAKRQGRDVHFFLATGTKPVEVVSVGNV